MENSAYMESVAGDRAVLAYDHDEESAHDGAQLISAETDPDLQREQDIFIFINGDFAAFLCCLRNLSLRDQELLLAYHCLRKTQTQLAPIFQTSQTPCSASMRAAVRAMCAYIAFGGQPTEEQMRPILQAEGLEEAKLQGVRPRRYKEDHKYVTSPTNVSSDTTYIFSLSQLFAEYAVCKSFAKLADRHGIHRPEIRRALRNAEKQLLESRLQDRRALGAWIHMLIEKANHHGPGVTKRQAAKEGDIHRVDPPELGLFRVMICKDSADILDLIFAPHGNQ